MTLADRIRANAELLDAMLDNRVRLERRLLDALIEDMLDWADEIDTAQPVVPRILSRPLVSVLAGQDSRPLLNRPHIPEEAAA